MKRTLLVIDMANDFVHEKGSMYIGEQAQKIVPYINDTIEEIISEKDDGNVYFVTDCHGYDDQQFINKEWPKHCIYDSWGREIYSPILQKCEDLSNYNCSYWNFNYFDKSDYDAFYLTYLAEELKDNGVKTVELVGVCTDICVFLTAAGAYRNGFKVKVHNRGCATFTNNHEFALEHMKLCFKAQILG